MLDLFTIHGRLVRDHSDLESLSNLIPNGLTGSTTEPDDLWPISAPRWPDREQLAGDSRDSNWPTFEK